MLANKIKKHDELANERKLQHDITVRIVPASNSTLVDISVAVYPRTPHQCRAHVNACLDKKRQSGNSRSKH